MPKLRWRLAGLRVHVGDRLRQHAGRAPGSTPPPINFDAEVVEDVNAIDSTVAVAVAAGGVSRIEALSAAHTQNATVQTSNVVHQVSIVEDVNATHTNDGARSAGGTFAAPKMAALHIGGQDRAASTTTLRNLMANYDLVIWGLYQSSSLATTARASMTYMRNINPSIQFINYIILNELLSRRITSITRTGLRVRVSYPDTYSAPQVASGTAGQVHIRQSGNAAYDGGPWTVVATGTSGSSRWFEFNLASGAPPNITDSKGNWCRGNDASRDAFLKIGDNDWWVRNATTGEQVQWTAGYAADEVNFTEYAPVDSNGHRYSRWRADSQQGETMGSSVFPLLNGMFMDNIFRAPRASGDYRRNGTNQTSSDATLAREYREGYVAFRSRILFHNPSYWLVGNIDHDMLDAEYQGVFNGLFEGAVGPSWAMENLNNNWSALQKRWNAICENSADRTRTVFCCSSEDIGWTDGAKFRYGLVAFLMQDGGYYQFTGPVYDMAGGVIHDEFNVPLGIATELPQTVPRSISGTTHIWARRFQNGIAIANAHHTSSQTVPFSWLGSGYRRIAGTVSPSFNTGAAVTANLSLSPRSGIILIRS